MQGKYIVLEGPTCVGKGTQMDLLEKWFQERGLEVARTREPGGPEEAELIRKDIFRLRREGQLSIDDELWMFYAARGYSMEWVAKECRRGKLVLKDRDYLSTRLIQAQSGVEEAKILAYHQKLYEEKGFLEPDLRIMLLIGEEELVRRLRARGAMGDAFDEDVAFALGVVRRYAALAVDIERNEAGEGFRNTVVVSGEGAPEVVFGRLTRIIETRLEGSEGREGWYPGESSRRRR